MNFFPCTNSIVFSSGATIPALPPPSIVMLQTVILPSMVISSNALPLNSIACPVPPSTPILPIIESIRSLGVTPKGKFPKASIDIVFGFFCKRVCVAKTCSTSEVPMPNANAPKAP